MRVALVQPRFHHPAGPILPYSLLVLAAALRRHGHDVQIIDEQLGFATVDELRDVDVIGITCMGGDMALAGLMFVDRIRSAGLDLPTVWGGALITMLGDLALEDSRVSYVVRGHGEAATCHLLSAIGARKRQNKDETSGMYWEHMDASLHPLPYSLVEMNRYSRLFGVPCQTSRGCHRACRFCYLTQWLHRPRSTIPAAVVGSELAMLQSGFGVHRVCFVDDDMFADRNHVLGVADEIRRRELQILWEASGRADAICSLSRDELVAIHRAGCRRIHIGGESGSGAELARMGKEMAPESLTHAVDKCRKAGISAHLNFILGFPGCTIEDLRETVKLMRVLDVQYADAVPKRLRLSVFTPWPGTAVYDEAVSLGFRAPSTLEEWGKYSFFDLDRLGIVPDEVRRLSKAVFNADFVFRVLPHQPNDCCMRLSPAATLAGLGMMDLFPRPASNAEDGRTMAGFAERGPARDILRELARVAGFRLGPDDG